MSDYESDDGYESGDEWLYMEENVGEADELAETQCPSPPPFDYIPQDYDPYEYWEDLTYLSDGGYHDEENTTRTQPKPIAKKVAKEAGSRKRKAAAEKVNPQSKRRRTGQAQSSTRGTSQLDNISKREVDSHVVWRSSHERDAILADVPALREGSSVPVMVLSTWREQNKQEQTATQPSESKDAIQDAQPSPIDSAIAGEGFDLQDIQSVAGLLSSEHIDTLKSILEAQGLDPEALETVLRDLIEGRDPEFDEEEQQGGEGDQD